MRYVRIDSLCSDARMTGSGTSYEFRAEVHGAASCLLSSVSYAAGYYGLQLFLVLEMVWISRR